MTRAYYNEIDKYAAAWLRNLIAAGHIADGDVDERSIVDVRGSDLAGYTQCHFFAGIGVWSRALRLAQWPDDRRVWTGSCPCQPFSAAGKQAGTDDSRHLWPHWNRLIRECQPDVIFGEQVEAAIGHGWLDLVCDDLEGQGYAVGSVGLPAASVGAPHIRQRLWFVADSNGGNARAEREQPSREHRLKPEDCVAGGLADAAQCGRVKGPGSYGSAERTRDGSADDSWLGHAGGARLEVGVSDRRIQREAVGASPGQTVICTGDLGWLEDPERAEGARLGQHSGQGLLEQEAAGLARPGGTGGWWGSAEWIYCTDEKYRPIEPGVQPLADGITGRVGRLRAYGNAIVAPLAAEFIKAYMQ